MFGINKPKIFAVSNQNFSINLAVFTEKSPKTAILVPAIRGHWTLLIRKITINPRLIVRIVLYGFDFIFFTLNKLK